MASESRQLPDGHLTRITALDTAKAKNTATAGAIITVATQGRLGLIQPLFRSKYDALGLPKQVLANLTVQKDGYQVTLKMVCSHFIQVFNLAVDRGVFTTGDRAFYKLDVSNSRLPEMGTEAELDQVAKDLIQGEADRILAGGAPMSMPPIADVQTAFNNFDGILMPHSTATDALDTAQEALDELNTEADAVIKKVWDEVETYYNEETPSSQRQNAREWGVVYVLRGSLKMVSGQVVNDTTNLPVPGALIHFENGTRKVTTDAQGNFELNTYLMDEQDLLAEHDLYNDFSTPVTLVENENIAGLVLRMVPLA